MPTDAAPAGPTGPAASAAQRGWLRRLAGYCGRHRRDVVLAFGAALVGTAFAVAAPLVQRHVVDRLVAPQPAGGGGIGGGVLLLLALAVGQFGCAYVRRWHAGRLSLDVQYDLRDDVFAALQRLDGARQDEVETGQLVSRANSDITLVQGLLGFLPNVAGQAALFLLAIVVMAVLSPLLTVVALLLLPALMLIATRSRRRLFPATWDAQQQAGVVAGVVEEDVTGVRVVKGFGQEARELVRLEAAARRLFASRLRAVRLTARYSPALQAVPALGQVGVLALGGVLVLHRSISVGTFLAFSTYLAQLVGPVRVLAGLLTIGQQARAGVVRVLEVVDSQPVVTERPDAVRLDDARVRGELELDGVTFGYVRSRPVLRDVTLRVSPGETVALVGATGSGKSTVSVLLPRFYDVQDGSVRFDGHDVRDLDIASVRRQIGLVPEEAFLFSDTVRANIAYGVPDATDAQVAAAAALAEADGFVADLPAGYDTVVGEQGLTLSGGQRQRIALARALLTDPRVLLLDDATSALDARVEADVLASLRRVMAGRTTLLVAHRRSTLALADRIVVLDGGRVVDEGTQAELQARSPLFRSLLSGPGDDAEGLDAGTTAYVVGPLTEEPQVDGVTPSLWPPDAPVAVGPTATVAPPAGSGPMGGALSGLPATPELLAQVAALPAATSEPHVDLARAAQPDPGFGLRTLLRPLRGPFAVALLLVGLDALAQLGLPALTRHGLDGVARGQGHPLGVAALLSLAVVGADFLVVAAQTTVTGRTGERLLFTLRLKTFAHLQRLGLDYYERELAGRVMTRMTTDVDALSSFLQSGVTTAAVSVLQVGGVLLALVLLDPRLALAALSVLPFLVVTTVIFRARSARQYAEARERVSAVNADLQENLSGVRTAQSFTREARSASHFRELADAYRRSRLRAQRLISLYFPFVELLAQVSAAAVLAAAAGRVRDGSLTPGALVAFLLYLTLFFAPVQSLSQVFDGYQQAAVGLARLRELLRTPASTPAPEHPVELPVPLRGELLLDDVHFAYAGAATQALAGVTLRVAPGETVSLVGETGAGKSTVVKLAARFYDASSGRVCLDGIDVRDLDPSAFRQRLGVVPQEAFLFAGTVRDNIAYGRPLASDAQVEAAARAVGAHDAVARLPLGYRTAVGERGRALSAGQRQLVSLARAQLIDPDVLLLDEATASLDLASEAAYVASAARLSSRRTTIVVAHRLTTAARADRVVVLHDGRIAEEGQHAELLLRGGAYTRLWEAYAEGGARGDTAAAPGPVAAPVADGAAG